MRSLLSAHAGSIAAVVGSAVCFTSVPVQRDSTPLAHSAAAQFPSDSAVLALLRQRVEEKRSAGIVVGMLNADGTTRVVAYGDPGPGRPALDANSVFEIGSISKVFTSTVLAELVQEGVVSLDDPAQKYLPAGVQLPTRNGKQITLANLSEQNSGLPRMPSNFHPKDSTNPYADYTVQQMYAFLSGYTLTRDPGEQFEYSESRRRPAGARAVVAHWTVVRGHGARTRVDAARHGEHRDRAHAEDESTSRPRAR